MGYIYEHKLDHPCKGMTGFDIKDTALFDELIMIRTIEANKEQIKKDPEVIFPVTDKRTVKHIYKEYCPVHLNNLEDIRLMTIKKALDFTYLED